VDLWDDQWNILFLKLKFPQLHFFARNKKIKLHRAIQSNQNNGLHSLFQIPLSYEAFEQFSVIQDIFDQTQRFVDNDVWSYIYGTQLSTQAQEHTN
jgi:hypothetical protein